MKSEKETDGIVEERTVLGINQGKEGDEAGDTNRVKVVKFSDAQARRETWRQTRSGKSPNETGSLPLRLLLPGQPLGFGKLV